MDTDGKFALGVRQVIVRDSSEESNIGRLLAIPFSVASTGKTWNAKHGNQ